MQILSVVLTIIIAYLFGSINFAIITSKVFAGKDVRNFGSGNAGLTNIMRNFGKLPAILTLLGDFSKGIFAIIIGSLLFQYLGDFSNYILGAYIAAIAVLLGHIFPVFYGFRGGKGVLTSVGIVLMLDWRCFILVLSAFILVTITTKYVSLGSIIGAFAFTLSTVMFKFIDNTSFNESIFKIGFSCLILCMVVITHRANIKRLLNGTENKIGKKKVS